jgi:hypothetical protein
MTEQAHETTTDPSSTEPPKVDRTREMLAAERRMRHLVARNGPISKEADLSEEFYRNMAQVLEQAFMSYRCATEAWIRQNIADSQAREADSKTELAQIYACLP